MTINNLAGHLGSAGYDHLCSCLFLVSSSEGASRGATGGTSGSGLMQRMTDALSRMLNDPSTRMAMRTLSDQREGNDDRSEGSFEVASGEEESLNQEGASGNQVESSSDAMEQAEQFGELSRDVGSLTGQASQAEESVRVNESNDHKVDLVKSEEAKEGDKACDKDEVSSSQNESRMSEISKQEDFASLPRPLDEECRVDITVEMESEKSKSEASQGDPNELRVETEENIIEDASDPGLETMHESISSIQESISTLRESFIDRLVCCNKRQLACYVQCPRISSISFASDILSAKSEKL